MFAKLQTRRDIPLLATYAFQYWNIGLVKYTYCRYTAVQPTLIEVTNLWSNFYDNIAKLHDDETPQLASFAFQCRNAVNVKCIRLRCFKSPTCRALFCDKFAKLDNDDIRSLGCFKSCTLTSYLSP